MSQVFPAGAAPRARVGVKVWHLALLVLFAAVAIRDIQDHGRREPALIALAAVGFGAYGVVGCVGWVLVRRHGGRVGPVALFAAYAVAMALLFMAATVVYLLIEYAYVAGLR